MKSVSGLFEAGSIMARTTSAPTLTSWGSGRMAKCIVVEVTTWLHLSTEMAGTPAEGGIGDARHAWTEAGRSSDGGTLDFRTDLRSICCRGGPCGALEGALLKA